MLATILLYVVLIVLLIMIVPKVYNIDSFIIPVEEETTPVSPMHGSSVLDVAASNLQCIARLKDAAPLQSCNKITYGVNNRIDDYEILVGKIQPILDKVNDDILEIKKQYGQLLDHLIDEYKTSEDIIRQQNFFKSQNGNVININTKYNTDLTKLTDTAREQYEINLDSFHDGIKNENQVSSKMNTIMLYTKITLVIFICLIFANVLFLQISK